MGDEGNCMIKKTPVTLNAVKVQLAEAECKAIGPHHGDKCNGGRIQSPNAQFSQNCAECKGTGKRIGRSPLDTDPLREESFTTQETQL